MQPMTIEEWVAASRNEETVEAFGFGWSIQRIQFFNLSPHKIPVAKIELASPPAPELAGFVSGSKVVFIIKTDGYIPETEDRETYLAHIKAEAIRLAEIQAGTAYGYLTDALMQHPETADHEAIARGRDLLRAGRLESQEAMVEFIDSIE